MVRARGSPSASLMAAVLLSVVLAPCSDSPPRPVSAQVPATFAPPAPAVTPTAQAAVERAYREAWAVMLEAGRTADYQDERLWEWMSGAQLSTVRRRLYALAQQHRTLRGRVQLNPTVQRVRGARAMLRDCQDSSQWLAYDGIRPVGRAVPRRDLVVATLVYRTARRVPRIQPDGRTRWVQLGPGWQVTSTQITLRGC